MGIEELDSANVTDMFNPALASSVQKISSEVPQQDTTKIPKQNKNSSRLFIVIF
jgi:hypothetical protein